jgi:hypothetical protein
MGRPTPGKQSTGCWRLAGAFKNFQRGLLLVAVNRKGSEAVVPIAEECVDVTAMSPVFCMWLPAFKLPKSGFSSAGSDSAYDSKFSLSESLSPRIIAPWTCNEPGARPCPRSRPQPPLRPRGELRPRYDTASTKTALATAPNSLLRLKFRANTTERGDVHVERVVARALRRRDAGMLAKWRVGTEPRGFPLGVRKNGSSSDSGSTPAMPPRDHRPTHHNFSPLLVGI